MMLVETCQHMATYLMLMDAADPWLHRPEATCVQSWARDR